MNIFILPFRRIMRRTKKILGHRPLNGHMKSMPQLVHPLCQSSNTRSGHLTQWPISENDDLELTDVTNVFSNLKLPSVNMDDYINISFDMHFE